MRVSDRFPSREDRSLELRDSDPYDYAKAERVFPESTLVKVEFRMLAKGMGLGELHMEITDRRGMIAAMLLFDGDGGIKSKGHVLGAYVYEHWCTVSLIVDAITQRWELTLDGRVIVRDAPTVMPVRSVERLVFRTGPRRREPTLHTNRRGGDDLPNADAPTLPAIFCVNSVRTSEHRLSVMQA